MPTASLLLSAVCAAAAVMSGGTPGPDVSTLTVRSTGAPAQRTLSERFAEVVDVRDFGAVGDGTKDDAAALQAALLAANDGPVPRTVLLPAGTYRVSAQHTYRGPDGEAHRVALTIPYNKFNVEGVGGFAVLQMRGDGDVLAITGGSGALSNLHLFRVDGKGGGMILTGGQSVGGAGAENRFTRLRISGHHTVGVQMNNAYLTTFMEPFIADCETGILDLGTSQATELISANLVKNGVNLDWASAGLTVVGGAIEQATVADVRVGTNPTTARGPARLAAYGVHFEHNGVSNPGSPMITVGAPGAPSNTSVELDGCSFWGNSARRSAVLVNGGHATVRNAHFASFRSGGPAVLVFSRWASGMILPPMTYDAATTAQHKSFDAQARVSDLAFDDVSDANGLRVGRGPRQTLFPMGIDTVAVSGHLAAAGNIGGGGRLVIPLHALPYGPIMRPDASSFSQFVIDVQDGRPFTIEDASQAAAGQVITVLVRNVSGRGLGAVSWGPTYHLAGPFVAPARGHSRAISFLCDERSQLYEVSRTTGDVPN